MEKATVKAVRDKVTLHFDVTVDGTVHQELSVSAVLLDEVRLLASDQYLNQAKHLSKSQLEYWQGVHRKTDIKNFGPIPKHL